ncbi:MULTISPECIES: hypothetical protein [Dietzia]|uniref:Uncharacterized protein n=3 Tax=Dietzia cinnamea TaxID=321318 RepID=A0ABV3YMX3_9ACTN|nr:MULTISPECIES: hypothetical protein [Dietzia]MBM7231833.1 hypothetical protein [Dietzia cinnamea]MCT1713430.1 hypothetical protein [Dietzia cinnamea]MCT1865299.1 hypothetical protein [Dietzia cinnamea]MCT2031303.1 hypothetical protein [Dietzia cinnamea]MCT2033311.1 hypothetical protein [Dietzia cinnamea]
MKRNFVPANDRTPLRMLVKENAQRIVEARGGLRRIVASDDYSAVLYGSHLHPERLDSSRPNIVVECHSGEWFGLDPSRFNVGYGGSGPSDTRDTLQLIGVTARAANQIAHATYSDLTFDANGNIVDSSSLSTHALTPVIHGDLRIAG